MAALIRTCWSHSPEQRPSFTRVVEDVRALQRNVLGDVDVEDNGYMMATVTEDAEEQLPTGSNELGGQE